MPDPSVPPTPPADTCPNPDDRRICSAKGCRATAAVDLRWRNPGVHDAARVKHWLACPDHVEYLADFLARRGFLLGQDPIES